jgi:PhoH-like ATPase
MEFMNQEKIYIIDTNVILDDPRSLLNFEPDTVGIPIMVLQELDKFKKDSSDRGKNCRAAIRLLDSLRAKGSLQEGITLDHGGKLRIIFTPIGSSVSLPFRIYGGDDEILISMLELKKQGHNIIFVSKDINARVKAEALGITAEDYTKQSVSKDEFYMGWRRLSVPAVQLKQDAPEEFLNLTSSLTVNEFILVESQHNPYNYKIFRYLGGSMFRPVVDPKLKWPLKARNAQQLMALDLLLDNSIQCVTLFGGAGTGKTFLALLAGLHKVLIEDEFEKMLISRPVVPLGRDIGYLPGTIEEKLHSWMLPIYDNMEFIVHSAQSAQHVDDINQELTGKKRSKKWKGKKHSSGIKPLDELIAAGKLSLEAITYMRGRSIPYQYILIDEVQNLTAHEVKTLVSRVGEGSKIILTGDPYQIDSPYLDFSSNGLVVTSEKLKGQPLFGTVFLEKSERSQLSQIVSELL